MKKLNLIIIITVLFFNSNYSQEESNEADKNRIVLSAYLPNSFENIPSSARNILQRKLDNIVIKNSLAGINFSNRFILTANIDISNKNITPTAPPMYAYTFDVTFVIGDGVSGIKFSSATKTIKGVGKTEDVAFIQAVKAIKAKDDIYSSMIEEGKNKIINYFNNQCDFIIKEAQGLADQNRYEEALFKLFSVPQVSKECYDKCIDNIKPMYQKHIDRQCAMLLIRAKGIWNANQNYEAAKKAAEILATIEPNSSCFSDVQILFNEISTRIRTIDSREWDYKLKELNQVSELINAYNNIGVAWGENQPENTFNIRGWF